MRDRGADIQLTLGALLSRHRWRVARYGVLLLLASAPIGAAGWIVRVAVDGAVRGHSRVGLAGGSFAVIAVVSFVLYWRLGREIGVLTREARGDADRRVLAGLLSRAVTDSMYRPAGGAELARYGDALAGLLIGLTQGAPGIAIGLATLGGVIVAAPPLAPLAVALAVGVGLLVFLAVQLLTAAQEALLASTDRSSAVLAEGVDGVRDVVAYGAQDFVARRAAAAFDDERAQALRLATRSAIVSVISGAAGVVAATLVMLRAIDLRAHDVLSPGQTVGGITQAVIAQAAITGVALWAGRLIVSARALSARIAARTAAHPGLRIGDPAKDIALRVVDLSFSWGVESIVDHLDLEIPPGDHLAIVGPSGIGKSTLAGLLAGTIAPRAGAVLLAGIDVRTHPSAQTTLAMVPQESYVFGGTLRENLTVLAPHVADDTVLEAVRAIGLENVVERIGGLDAAVSIHTSGLSSGEQQLICLARVWLSRARVLILDEATCYLDPASEARAEEVLAERPDTTLVVIAHRLSSARRARRILVMDGHAIQVGSHDELVESNSLYAALVGQWGWSEAATTSRDDSESGFGDGAGEAKERLR